MKTVESAALRELRKWRKHRIGDGWVRRGVLRGLLEVPERDLFPALARLVADGKIEEREEIDEWTGEVLRSYREGVVNGGEG